MGGYYRVRPVPDRPLSAGRTRCHVIDDDVVGAARCYSAGAA